MPEYLVLREETNDGDVTVAYRVVCEFDAPYATEYDVARAMAEWRPDAPDGEYLYVERRDLKVVSLRRTATFEVVEQTEADEEAEAAV